MAGALARPVVYRVRVLPQSRELEVEMSLHAGSGPVLLQFPTWIPGSYRLQPYARNVVELQAFDETTGLRLCVSRNGWQGFRVDGGRGPLCIRYRTLAADRALSQACSFVDSDAGLVQGTTFPYVPGLKAPCVLLLEVPSGWKVHTTGGRGAGDGLRFENYEELLDSPVAVGRFDLLERQIGSARFYFLFLNRALGFEEEAEGFVETLSRVAAECGSVFGGFPFPAYTFVVTTRPDLRWGLEHLNCCLCGVGPDVFVDRNARDRALRMCGHELFHAWNVRRLRPAPFGRGFDLERGSFTEGLWLAEGFTRYYEFLVATRAGIYSPGEFFSTILNYWQNLLQTPGYRITTAIDASLATFLNHTRFEGAANGTIDYYQKGMLIAFDLDVMLREGGDSLDSVMAELHRRFSERGCGYTTDAVIDCIAERHREAARLLAREAKLPGGLSTMEQLRRVGWRPLVRRAGSLGLEMDGGARVASVLRSGPGSVGGLAPGDIVTAIDGFEFSEPGLSWAASRNRLTRLTVLRGHQVRQCEVRPQVEGRVEALEWHGSETQAAAVRCWLKREDFRPREGVRFGVGFYENFHGRERFV